VKKLLFSVTLALIIIPAHLLAANPQFKQIAKYTLGGEGGWDYLTFDPQGNRLFIAHNKEVLVVDAASGKKLGSVPADGAHGVAMAEGKGFSTNGRAGTVSVFDAQTLKPVLEIKVGENPDAIIYDPDSKRVVVMNGRSKDVMVIDPSSLKITNTVPIGGKLEFAAADAGHVYVNVEDTGEIVDLDSRQWKVLHRWKLTGCEEPSGLAIDEKSKHLFTVCGNKVMAIVDARDGKVIATLPTGSGTDGVAFDPGTGEAFASNGEGTMTVVRKGKDGKYSVEQNITTQRGARTLTLDTRSHRVYTATAEFEAPVEGQRRPAVKPGTFAVLVYSAK
jgi:YVTN family beta-propeller protein